MDPFTSGSGEFLFSVVGFIALGIAMAYGTWMWNKRRQRRPPGTIGRAPGPAPKSAEGRDTRTAA